MIEARKYDASYGDWTVVGPSGKFMFHSGPKKVNWYLQNGLARRVSPRCIQLSVRDKKG